MPKAKAPTSLLAMMDSEVENSIDQTDLEMLPQQDSNQENAAARKTTKSSAKPSTSKVRKTKPASKRLSGGKAAPKKKTVPKRAPLKEQINEGRADDTEGGAEEVVEEIQNSVSADESEAQIPKKQPVKRGGRKAKNPAKKTMLDVGAEVQVDDGFELNSAQSDSTRHVGGMVLETQKAIAETQPELMEIDRPQSPEVNVEDEDAIPQSVYRQRNRIQPASRQRLTTISRKRAGSASGSERTDSDAKLRRKLGAMAEKLESLELRYKHLREIGVKEAEANYKKLKEQSDESKKAASDLIFSLKNQLTNHKILAKESHTLRQQLASKETELAECTSKAKQLATSLSESQMENKALQAKIAAVRSSSTDGIQSKAPGSALKNGKTPSRTLMMGSAEIAHTVQVAQLKEELYSDLTGLIIRGVDQSVEGTSYDCLQTGRNGTLHFILTIPALGTQTPGISYEDSAIQYSPRLDANRDRELLQLLPDYMTEEITFTRENAGGFYKKLFDKLTTKVVKE